MTSPHEHATFRAVGDQDRSGPGRDNGPLLVAPGSATNREFGLFEIEVAPGGSTPTVHYHTGFSESFYVLEGEIVLHLDGSEHTARAGDFAYVPRYSHHGFTNRSDEPARMLILFTPGIPREDYFRELGELFQRDQPPTDEEIDTIALRHDQINVRDA